MEFFNTTFGKPTVFIYVSSPLLEDWIIKKLSHYYRFIKGSKDFDIFAPWLSYTMIIDEKKLSAGEGQFLIDNREQFKDDNNWLILLNGETCYLPATEKVLLANSPTAISKIMTKLYCQCYPLTPPRLKSSKT